MYLIIGLGNPGKEYENTRHNMGFKAIDALACDTGIDVSKSKFHALIGRGNIAGEKVILCKPQTYMNLSGIAARECAMYFDIPRENVIVVYDDLDLPIEAIRIRKSGGPGTHNGMKSVVQQLGITDFPRIRIGVGAAKENEDIINRVIGKVPKSEQALLDSAAKKTAEAIVDIIKLGIDNAMNKHNYNPKKVKKAKAAQAADGTQPNPSSSPESQAENTTNDN